MELTDTAIRRSHPSEKPYKLADGKGLYLLVTFPHTCKSRACSSCGQRATLAWQREVAAMLPDIPFAGIGLTMPDVFWPIFQRNRRLLADLPAIGAGVLQDRAEQKFGAQVAILVVCHTFGAPLNFNAHLHVVASTVGLSKTNDRLVYDIRFCLAVRLAER